MPYVVIEAAAAGVPMIAANVGGIPEIFGPHDSALFAAGNVGAMAEAIMAAINAPQSVRDRAKQLRERISRQFSQNAMVDGVMAGYREAFAKR
jgi:glycosyltransferase involved in cell wall biosynthesis